MSISDWPMAERPREKLLHSGAASLQDAELLAIFLRVGVAGKSAVALAQELIAHFGSLSALFAASEDDIARIKGMGQAKYAQLQAVFEMSRRAMANHLSQHTVIADMAQLKTWLQLHLQGQEREQLMVLFLDAQLRLMHHELMHEGDRLGVVLHPRSIAHKALHCGASAVILAHNHPDGCAQPSNEDIESTRQLAAILQPLGVQVLDHLIVADGAPVCSMVELGHTLTS